MAIQHNPTDLIQKFLTEISHSFVDDWISEIKEAFVVDILVLEGSNPLAANVPICSANQLTGFYMMGTLAVKGLIFSI